MRPSAAVADDGLAVEVLTGDESPRASAAAAAAVAAANAALVQPPPPPAAAAAGDPGAGDVEWLRGLAFALSLPS
jgi:hypothetical protein